MQTLWMVYLHLVGSISGEQSKIMTYFVPQLGPAPRWCSFLESLTEELEENTNTTVYEDYKFLTKNELEELGATGLIGKALSLTVELASR